MPDISELTFTKDWRNPTDFPTYEGSEDQVRADMQQLYNEIQLFLNQTVVPAINALTQGMVTPNSVDTVAIVNGAVTLAKMAAASVGVLQLVDGSVTTPKLADAAVTLQKLSTLCVSTAQLIDYCVTNAKLANGSVTNEKLGTDIVPTSVGFVVGEGDPMEDPSLIAPGQVYLKLESE